MLTPARYWRVAKSLDELDRAPLAEFALPSSLMEQTAPPTIGDGILLAHYDHNTQTGLVRYVGLIRSRNPRSITVDWLPTMNEIWVDTPAGRGNWNTKPGFKFDKKKVTGYGLHQLFADTFPGAEARESLLDGNRIVRPAGAATKKRISIARERLEPVEVIGTPTDAPKGGFVYVLKSAYGYKVGRTRNVPNRMRAFGVKLPIFYTIPLCVWFEDHIEAELTYHRLFSIKHINGEWFELVDDDIDLIRKRSFSTCS